MGRGADRLWRIAPALALLAATACEMDPNPPSYLDDLRVLAVVAEPGEVGPGEATTLTPVVYVPEAETLEELSWTFCPVTLGSRAGYECALAACEVALEAEPSGAVTARPGQLAAACPLAAAGLAEPFESLFRLAVRTDAGAERVALARIPVWSSRPPPARNRPPVIELVEVGGEAVSPDETLAPVSPEESLEVRVVIDEASLDAYVDAAGRDRVEEPLISFYATAGRFERDRDIGVDLALEWTADPLEDDERSADLYVVARDLRGGQAVAGPYAIPIAR